MNNPSLLSLIVAGGMLLLLGQSAAAQSVQQIWTANCMACHGDRGQGGMTPSLLDAQHRGPETDRRFYDAIKQGREDDGMPAYGEVLTDAQIWGLVVHLREQQERQRRQEEPERRPQGQQPVQTQHHAYRLERVVEQGLSIPWALAFLPDGRILIAERPGTLRFHADGQLGEPIADTPEVTHAGQGGLMGIALHPQFADNGWVYLSYTHENDQGLMTRIVRGRIDDGRWIDQEVIFEARPEHYLGSRLHFGARIVFDGQGHLFFVIGDRGRGNDAQNLSRPNGKVHRLHDDGRIPADNPFVDNAEALGSIWSFGHRNPQGLVFDAERGQLWATEHGPRGGDELNLIERGANYGWPNVSHGINYNGSPHRTPWHEGEYVDPVLHWTPSIAACGLDQSRGEAFPSWQGDLLAGGLAGQVVERVRIRDGQVAERERIVERIGRVRDVVVAPDGTIYLALNGPDQVVRLVPAEE